MTHQTSIYSKTATKLIIYHGMAEDGGKDILCLFGSALEAVGSSLSASIDTNASNSNSTSCLVTKNKSESR